MKKALRIIIGIFLAILLVVGGYVAYVFIAYHRIGDMTLTPAGTADQVIKVGESYKMMSWNIGFAAYDDQFDFFMDGGKKSRAVSKERVFENLGGMTDTIKAQDPDILVLQEVDFDSTRSWGVDEREAFIEIFPSHVSVFCQNYDSPYLFYPIYSPHGANKSGILSFVPFTVNAAERRELPVESSVMKIVDLDRCYEVLHIPASDGHELVLYNMHLSAYTSDGSIATEQLKMLLSDMQKEYEKGNYCICGGDFNKDLLGDSGKYFGKADIEYEWAQPIPDETFENLNIRLIAPLDENDPKPTCRHPDSPYHEGQFVVTVDGFLASENVDVSPANVVDIRFAYSDHNPVTMQFVLNGEE